MAKFNYQGRNASGAQVNGSLDSANINLAAEQLAQQQIIVLKLEAVSDNEQSGFDANNINISDLLGFDAVKLDDLIILCRQMYALMRAGVPILRAINDESFGSPMRKARSKPSETISTSNSFKCNSTSTCGKRF